MSFIERILRRARREKNVQVAIAARKLSYYDMLDAYKTLHYVRAVHQLLAGAANRLTWRVLIRDAEAPVLTRFLDAHAGLIFADYLVLSRSYITANLTRTLEPFGSTFIIENPAAPLEAAFDLLLSLRELSRAVRQAFWRQGALVFAVPNNPALVPTPDEIKQARSALQASMREAGAGGIELLPVPLDIKASPVALKDYDFRNQSVMLIRELCNLFSIDSSLLNDPENKTYSNKTEAQKALMVNVIIPKAWEVAHAIEESWNISSDTQIRIEIDASAVESIAEERQRHTDNVLRLLGAGVITTEEARKMLEL